MKWKTTDGNSCQHHLENPGKTDIKMKRTNDLWERCTVKSPTE